MNGIAAIQTVVIILIYIVNPAGVSI